MDGYILKLHGSGGTQLPGSKYTNTQFKMKRKEDKTMPYHIQKVTLIREREEGQQSNFSFTANETVGNLVQYRRELKEKYRVKHVHLTYSEIPNEIQD